MKNERLVKVEAVTDQASNCHVLTFYFEPDGALIGLLSRGKRIQVKMGLKYRAADLAITLVKTVEEIYAELKKG
jgi:hypothetical protein